MTGGLAEEAQAFAGVARALQSEGTAQEILQRIVDLAPRLIEPCEHAGITMVVGRKVMTPAASGAVPLAVDRIQYEANQGPCLDALRKHAVYVSDDLRVETRWPDFAARAAAETGVRSMLSFRLFVEDDTLGSLNLYSTKPAAFGANETATGGVFAAHAAVALSSARDRDRADRLEGELASSELGTVALQDLAVVAAALQRSMLTVLPDLPGLDLCARYQPAVSARQVGGDWYDAFVLADGTVALVIGDVAGHDLDAAVRMAQARNLLRGLAFDRPHEPPSAILGRFDHTLTSLAVTETATCVYAMLDQQEQPAHAGAEGTAWRLRFASAGHPPPLLVTPEGSRFLETTEHLLLGLGGHDPRSDAGQPLPDGATLLLYTDGLVEHRGRSIVDGLASLRTLGATLAGERLDDFCDAILADLGAQPLDDVCMLAIRPAQPKTRATPAQHRS